MYYFFHGTSLESFINILKNSKIFASYYLPDSDKKYIRMNNESKYVFTNIYVDGLPLKSDEKAGLGRITLIIDPIILKYRICYFNYGWVGDNNNSLLFNDNVDTIIDYLLNNYQYPYILTHEVLFKKYIPMQFIIGIICDVSDEKLVTQYMNKYGYNLSLFNKFPTLIC